MSKLTFLIIFWVLQFNILSAISLDELSLIMEKKELTKLVEKLEGKLQNDVEKDYELLKMLGVAWHNLSVLGVKNATEKAYSYLKKCKNLNPEDYEVLIFLGSTITLRGRDAINPVFKIRYVLEGIKIIDRALDKEKNNVPMRLLRINNSLYLPEFFGRRGIAKKDLLFLESLQKKHPEVFTPTTLAFTYYRLGEIFKEERKIDKARAYWKKAVEVSPSSVGGREAKRYLEIFAPYEQKIKPK